jgi:hypothetical protein
MATIILFDAVHLIDSSLMSSFERLGKRFYGFPVFHCSLEAKKGNVFKRRRRKSTEAES